MNILDWFDRQAEKKAIKNFDAGFGHMSVQVLYKGRDISDVLRDKADDDFYAGMVAASALIKSNHYYLDPINACIAYNNWPEWPEIWVSRDEDCSVYVSKREPIKTYLKSDHTGAFELEPEGSKYLPPPKRTDPDWRLSPRRIKWLIGIVCNIEQ